MSLLVSTPVLVRNSFHT